VTIVTVTTVTWLKQDRYSLAIIFEHGSERDFNFFRNYPDLEVLLKEKLTVPGWRMRPIFDRDETGIKTSPSFRSDPLSFFRQHMRQADWRPLWYRWSACRISL